MTQPFDLQEYLSAGVEKIVKEAVRATLRNPRESAFMARFAITSAKAEKRRKHLEKDGLHVPSYLIASITSRCNLHCTGCYSRCSNATQDAIPVSQLKDEEWLCIFDEAEELGIPFILLAGGEPLLRRGVIESAGKRQNILFPIFTNGTYMDDAYLDLFDHCRNLLPVMSLEGGQTETDARRGDGVYERLMTNMGALSDRGVVFGASVTVTTQNLSAVTSPEFVDTLARCGCKAVIYVEYVPVDDTTRDMAFGDDERVLFQRAIAGMRASHSETLFISFPGDEKSSGGCLAAGRGFFHINSHGGAEPCPFSPYSDINVKDTSLRDALNSRLFRELQDGGYLLEDHIGGCVLHEKRMQVEAIVNRS